MIILILFAFLGGLVTILSPCILPILPIVLSGSLTSGKKRPFGVITGFIISFTVFTLSLSTIIKLTGVSADSLRNFSVFVVGFFGLTLIIPKLQILMEQFFSKLTKLTPKNNTNNEGFTSGLLIGISLGLVWAPCVGPILASIITLAATNSVTTSSFFVTLAYSIGTAIPMLAITYGGRQLLLKVPQLINNTGKIQKAFGIIMILTAISIYLNIDRKFQSFIINKFPLYGVGLTKFENNPYVLKELDKLQNKPVEKKEEKSMLDDLSPFVNAPEFIPGGKWFNTSPLTIKELRGKVVLVDFWTYTCINCIRTLPYLKTWHEKYKDKGLVIVGVHTPEFEFEKEEKNVQKALHDFGITYPVMQDNDYATWNVYANRYWPAKYFIDKNGKIRSFHFGEGDYDESEKVIQTLLKETGVEINNEMANPPGYQTFAGTPETYLGYKRMEFLESPENVSEDKLVKYTLPDKLGRNKFALNGSWNIGGERATPTSGSTLILNFEAKEVFLVMRPKKDSGQIKVTLDGKIVDQDSKGEDVIKNGIVDVNSDRLYKLIKLQNPGQHVLQLDFLDDNLELYAFTFG